MSYRCSAFLFFILILVFLLISPGIILAAGTSTQDSTSSTQQGNNQFRVEVSKNGFISNAENTSGELLLEVDEGQKVEITFVFTDDPSEKNAHIIYIRGYKIQTETLDNDNPEVTVKFTANKTGEFFITCIIECAGHGNLQEGKLEVAPVPGSQENIIAATVITMDLEAPNEAETGEPIILAALVKDELGNPVDGVQANFFIESDFFVESLMPIGEMITNEQGLAEIDYTPNQNGIMRFVVRNEAGGNLVQVESVKEVNINGNSKSFYKTAVGIQFPYSLLIWMLVLSAAVITIWGIFINVLSQMLYISLGTRSKKFVIFLIVSVVILCLILVQLIITQEAQYHYWLLP